MANSQFLSSCSADAIQNAAEQLMAGHLVAFPTETVYGLGADANNEKAVKRIYEVKGRPTNHPLIVHISSINTLGIWAQNMPEYAIDLARAFWPGPMTLILKRTAVAKDFITGGQNSVGIRIPSDPIATKLLQHFESLGGLGIAAPSANRFGQVSATDAESVLEELEEVLKPNDLVLDGGNSNIGIESTIIDCTSDQLKILRHGSITIEILENYLQTKIFEIDTRHPIKFSGHFDKHYAPRAKVILDAEPKEGQGLIALKNYPTPKGVNRLAEPTDLEEFAQLLYFALRQADHFGLAEVVIIQPSNSGIGRALRERLLKSSNGR